MILKNLQLICKKYKQCETKRNGQKLLKTTQIAYYFVRFMEGRTIKVVFELLVYLSITWHDLGITFLDVSKFLITGILICKMLLFVK